MIHRRRFLQISIRTLLIVTTLVAIGCAYWTRVLRRMEQQRVAAARIADRGTRVTKAGVDTLQRALPKCKLLQ